MSKFINKKSQFMHVLMHVGKKNPVLIFIVVKNEWAI